MPQNETQGVGKGTNLTAQFHCLDAFIFISYFFEGRCFKMVAKLLPQI